jgi:hypothetical protein
MIRIRSIAALLSALALAACGEDAVQSITAPLTGARVKFFNFGVNAPGVNFYANDAKMTAISSTTGAESTTGTASGAAASGGFYSALTAGQYTLSGRIAAATDKDLAIASVSTAVVDGKSYSFYLSGIYDGTAKKVDAFVVEDPFPEQIDFTVASVRFVNAISNAGPMTLFAKNTTTGAEVPVGAAVPYKGAGAFASLPNGIYDLVTRNAGSSADVIARAAVSFSAGRVYTISSRGDMTVTGTTAANRPQLDNTANR